MDVKKLADKGGNVVERELHASFAKPRKCNAIRWNLANPNRIACAYDAVISLC